MSRAKSRGTAGTIFLNHLNTDIDSNDGDDGMAEYMRLSLSFNCSTGDMSDDELPSTAAWVGSPPRLIGSVGW